MTAPNHPTRYPELGSRATDWEAGREPSVSRALHTQGPQAYAAGLRHVQGVTMTDVHSRAEIGVAIANVNARAKRIPHVVGTPLLPSEWDRRHAQINAMLYDWESATA